MESLALLNMFHEFDKLSALRACSESRLLAQQSGAQIPSTNSRLYLVLTSNWSNVGPGASVPVLSATPVPSSSSNPSIIPLGAPSNEIALAAVIITVLLGLGTIWFNTRIASRKTSGAGEQVVNGSAPAQPQDPSSGDNSGNDIQLTDLPSHQQSTSDTFPQFASGVQADGILAPQEQDAINSGNEIVNVVNGSKSSGIHGQRSSQERDDTRRIVSAFRSFSGLARWGEPQREQDDASFSVGRAAVFSVVPYSDNQEPSQQERAARLSIELVRSYSLRIPRFTSTTRVYLGTDTTSTANDQHATVVQGYTKRNIFTRTTAFKRAIFNGVLVPLFEGVSSVAVQGLRHTRPLLPKWETRN